MIKKIPAVQLGKVMGVIGAVIGLIVGILVAIISIIGSKAVLDFITAIFPAYEGNLIRYSFLFGVGAIVVLPLITFAVLFINGWIIAVIYNFVAPRIGGIKLGFEE
ncbi:hypothetical protein KAI12_03705 [Candidatus Bathyarchaeota archaeon]|nr:hypothetical protein [Candidatus Bathyarchaeota archaeon]